MVSTEQAFCDGSSACPATVHVHGCYRDDPCSHRGSEQALCPHGLPNNGDCELCIHEQWTADDQATDDDWYDEGDRNAKG